MLETNDQLRFRMIRQLEAEANDRLNEGLWLRAHQLLREADQWRQAKGKTLGRLVAAARRAKF
jgi:hypothetical protein